MAYGKNHVLSHAKGDDGFRIREDAARLAALDGVEGFPQPKVAKRKGLMA
jgi:hypothetical protein